MNQEFISKMLQAKKLEKEALKALLPKEVTSHMEVIHHEVKAMAVDLVKEVIKQTGPVSEEKEQSESTVKKVNIE